MFQLALSTTTAMIYDVTSPAYQQFLRRSGRKREDFGKKSAGPAIAKGAVAKPAGAASTGL